MHSNKSFSSLFFYIMQESFICFSVFFLFPSHLKKGGKNEHLITHKFVCNNHTSNVVIIAGLLSSSFLIFISLLLQQFVWIFISFTFIDYFLFSFVRQTNIFVAVDFFSFSLSVCFLLNFCAVTDVPTCIKSY